MRVRAFDIDYKNNTTYLTLSGPDSLEAYTKGILTIYDAESAPKSLIIEIEKPDNFGDIDEIIRKKLEEETGLEVSNFSFIIL